jgi:hypothetical protein
MDRTLISRFIVLKTSVTPSYSTARQAVLVAAEIGRQNTLIQLNT